MIHLERHMLDLFLLLSLPLLFAITWGKFKQLRKERSAKIQETRKHLNAAFSATNRCLDYQSLASDLCRKIFSDNEHILKRFLAAHDNNKLGFQATFGNALASLFGITNISRLEEHINTLEQVRFYLPAYHRFMFNLIKISEAVLNENLEPKTLSKSLDDSFNQLKTNQMDKRIDDVFIFEWHVLTMKNLVNNNAVQTQDKIASLAKIASTFHHHYQNQTNSKLHDFILTEQSLPPSLFETRPLARQMAELVDAVCPNELRNELSTLIDGIGVKS